MSVHNLRARASALFDQGKIEQAITLVERACAADGTDVEAWLLLSRAQMRVGNPGAAEHSAQRAVGLDPGLGKAHLQLAMTLQMQGNLAAAEACYREALRLDERQAGGHYNLGLILQERGTLAEAEGCYRAALRINPGYARAHANLGYVLRRQQRLEEAAASYREALRLEPKAAENHYNLGLSLHDLDRMEEAEHAFRAALRIKPDHANAWLGLADVLSDLGQHDDAAMAYRKTLALGRNDAAVVKLALLMPIIPQSRAEIDAARTRIMRELDALQTQELVIDNPLHEINQTVFYLAYHGEDDRGIHEQLAKLYEKICPSLLYTAPHCATPRERVSRGKIAVGFISAYFCEHTIGVVMKGIMAELSRELFTVTAFSSPHKPDPINSFIRGHVDEWVELPMDLHLARDQIAAHKLDVLFYTDIGMDPYTYFLAFSRLAPVQCVTWGHPVTTGIRNVDYYISCAHFEPAGAQSHYSEKLVCLDGPPTYYARPSFPSRLAPSHYGLEGDKPIYLCPQTLYKFHPDFDALLGGILRADPKGQLVLVDVKRKDWAAQLRQRFRRSIPDVAERIRIIPYPGMQGYLNLLAIADVMLDTLHYGGGSTSLQALAAGTPIVTLPGGFQKGRHTYGYYRRMGYMECVARDADDYIQIAIRLGTDRDYRNRVSAEILRLNAVLYENMDVVRQLEREFVDMHRRASEIS